MKNVELRLLRVFFAKITILKFMNFVEFHGNMRNTFDSIVLVFTGNRKVHVSNPESLRCDNPPPLWCISYTATIANTCEYPVVGTYSSISPCSHWLNWFNVKH